MGKAVKGKEDCLGRDTGKKWASFVFSPAGEKFRNDLAKITFDVAYKVSVREELEARRAQRRAKWEEDQEKLRRINVNVWFRMGLDCMTFDPRMQTRIKNIRVPA